MLFVCVLLAFLNVLVISLKPAPSISLKKRQSLIDHGKGLGVMRLDSRLCMGLFGGAEKAKGKKGCKICKGKGTVVCTGVRGNCVNGIDKKDGSILERYTCTVCKGFGFVPCSCSGSKGLTPEQSGER